MASKKYYAVKKGKTTGIFDNWEDCKASVDGYTGAQFKGFATLAEAEEYLKYAENMSETENSSKATAKPAKRKKTITGVKGDLPSTPDSLLAYVDGSYDHTLKKYAFGCVFLLADGSVYTEYGNGENEQSLLQRNVTGEMLGAMFATKFAMINGFSKLEIRYDYQGIEKWVTGEWRAKNELTQKYAKSMREWGQNITIHFTKVAAHTNVYYNELADLMAKTGLTKGNGVPKVRLLADMEIYDGTDEVE